MCDSVTQLDAANLLFDEWKFRHQHCWNSLRNYGLAAVTVSIVPYIKSDILFRLREAVLIFPVVAWFVALAAIWLFAAEYYRLQPISERHRELLDPYYPDRPALTGWKKILGNKIGWGTVYVFFIGFTILSILNGWLLWKLAVKVAVEIPVNR